MKKEFLNMRRNYKNLFTSFIFLQIAIMASGQQRKTYDLSKLFQEKKITIQNRAASVATDDKVVGLKLDEGNNEGVAWLNGVTFSFGTIEVDLRGKDVLQRSFIGIAFHGLNDSTYDVIYFRPFNFHSKDSVRKIHAVQYVSHPLYGWKRLREEHNGVYEKGLVKPPDPNGWFHARIEISGRNIKVFVNDDSVPSLTVTSLIDRSDGKIGLWVGDGSDGNFSALTLVTGNK